MGEQRMNWKRNGMIVGVVTGVFLGMKYVLPVVLPFLIGWVLAEMIHPMASYLASRKFSRKLHFTEGGVGSGVILLLLLLVFGFFMIGAEFMTQKAGDCMKYFPVLRQEAEEFIGHCCEGTEHITGIPAEKSSEYIYRQINLLKHQFWNSGNGVEKAVQSVKTCVAWFGLLMISVLTAILFLQERDKIIHFLEKQEFYLRVKEFGRKIQRGIKGYLKAQVKIMLIICLICIGGFWILGIPGFLGWGLTVGFLDALPILGTGIFLIPAGILFLVQGKSVAGIGFFLLYLIIAAIRQFMEPRLVGSHIGVSPLLVFVSVYLGVVAYGVSGFILGPLSALILYGIFTTSRVFHS